MPTNPYQIVTDVINISIIPIDLTSLGIVIDLTVPPFNMKFHGNYPFSILSTYSVTDSMGADLSSYVATVRLSDHYDYSMFIEFSSQPPIPTNGNPIVNVAIQLVFDGNLEGDRGSGFLSP